MKKIVKAVLPYAFQGKPNFKQQPYNAWINIGGQIAKPHYPPKFFHGMAYHFSFPYIGKNNEEARLRFVEPVSLNFDTFPDYIRYEIIPIIWDCWPKIQQKSDNMATKIPCEVSYFHLFTNCKKYAGNISKYEYSFHHRRYSYSGLPSR